MAASDVSTGIREFLLEPGAWTGQDKDAWHMWPGIWTCPWDQHARRLLLVWGDAKNRTLCTPVSLDKNGAAVPGDSVRSTRQLAGDERWVYLWPLERTDKLPGKYGPTVGDYIARLEAGKGETA